MEGRACYGVSCRSGSRVTVRGPWSTGHARSPAPGRRFGSWSSRRWRPANWPCPISVPASGTATTRPALSQPPSCQPSPWCPFSLRKKRSNQRRFAVRSGSAAFHGNGSSPWRCRSSGWRPRWSGGGVDEETRGRAASSRSLRRLMSSPRSSTVSAAGSDVSPQRASVTGWPVACAGIWGGRVAAGTR